jgi:hypothetical protein
MSILTPILFVIVGALAGAAAVGMYNRQKNLEKRIADLEETSNKKHLPYKVAEEIEDAMAAIIHWQYERKMDNEWLENAMNHLKNARNNRSSK